MNLEELENLMLKGKLKIEKRKWRIVYREKGWRGQKWDDTTIASWDKTRIPYQIYFYSARIDDMPEHSSYKITKKDYEKLLEIKEAKSKF